MKRFDKEYIITRRGVFKYNTATQKSIAFWSANSISSLGLTKAQFVEQRKYNDALQGGV
tara:strand:- start:6 stop:182 length:177 start_codon:yes stop_codon:yes gene_type:complete